MKNDYFAGMWKKIAYIHLAFSVYGAEIYWYICIQQRVENYCNKYLKHSKDYRTKIICAYERVRCFCVSEVNDDSPLEVWRLQLGPGVKYF